MILLRLILALAGVCLAWLAAPGAYGAPADSPFGINGATWSHVGANTDAFEWDKGVRRLDSLQQMGAAWDRCDFWWHRIEPEKGTFVWRDYDRIADEYAQRGLHLLPILCYDAAWRPEQSPETDEYRAEYGRFVHETVRHFKGRISAYEIWNEPNLSMYWRTHPGPEIYTKLLEIAYREAKRADPKVVVVGGAVAGMDFAFIEGMLKAGAGKHMDALSIHPYQGNLGSVGPEEGRLVEDLQRLKHLLRQYGHAELPVWITEMGHRTVPDPTVPKGGAQPAGRVSEQRQANYLVRSHALALSQGVEKIFWFNLQDWPTETWGTIAEDFRKKPSWYAFRTMASTLSGLEYSSQESSGGLHWLEFLQRSPYGVDTARYAALGWTESPGETVVLRSLRSQPTMKRPGYGVAADSLTDLLLITNGRDASVSVNGEPSYVVGSGPRPLVGRRSTVVSVSPSSVAPGDRFTLSVRYADPQVRAALANRPRAVLLTGPDSHASLKAYLEPAGRDTYRVRGTLPPGEYNVGYVWYSVMPRKGVTPARFEATARLTVRPALSIAIVPDPSQGRSLRMTVTNHSGRTLTAAVTVDMIGNRTDTISGIVLQPNEATTLPITNALSPEKALTMPLPVTARATAAGASASWSGNVFFWSAGKSWGVPLTLDSAQQWQSQDGSWTGPEDLSATIRARYDEHNLYLRAEVTDDTFSQTYSGAEVWRGDAFQIAIDSSWSRRPDRASSTEFGLALTPEGPQVYRWTGTPGLVPGAELKVARDGSVTAYEASIPWKEIGVTGARPGRSLGFSLILNDNDGEDRQGWLMYGDGIATEKRSDRYGTLTLLAAPFGG